MALLHLASPIGWRVGGEPSTASTADILALDSSLRAYPIKLMSIEWISMDRQLSPAEIAKSFGVSTKALRVYEEHGLLTPLRVGSGTTRSGWRAYGPEHVVRLHQIIIL
jgi:hypothetical protein